MKSAGINKIMKKYFALFLVLAMILGTSGNSARAVTLQDEAGSAATATDAPKEYSEAKGAETGGAETEGAEADGAKTDGVSEAADLQVNVSAEDVSSEKARADEVSDDEISSEDSSEEAAEACFYGRNTVDGVEITVTATAGVFPDGASLSVRKADAGEESLADAAVDKVRAEEKNVAESYTFDIKVLDKDGNEIQPDTSRGSVRVSFAMPEVSNANLDADIYHVSDHGALVAEELSSDVIASEASDVGVTEEVIAETDGFSYYTVEFTYNEKQYVMEGDSTVALTDILDYVGITKADGSVAASSDISTVSVSDESLFSATNESGEWVVTAHQAFTSTEWMKVTIDGVVFEIVVTDDVAYRVEITVNSVGRDNNWGRMNGIKETVNGVSKKNTYSTEVYDNAMPFTLSFETDSSPSNFSFEVTVDNGSTNYHVYTGEASCNSTSVTLNYNTCIENQWIHPSNPTSDGHPSSITVNYSVSISALHSHSWSYSANGNVITATCGGSGTCPIGDQTLTLGTVSDKMYNGTAQTVPSYTTSDGWTTANGLTEPGTVTVSPANSANAGTYTASVSVGGATAKSSWTISKAANPLTYTSTTQSVTKTFSTLSQTETLTAATNGQGTVSYAINSQKNSSNATVSYFSLSGTTLTVAENTPAGTYTVVVRATAAGNSNYNSGTKDSTVTVKINNASMNSEVSATGYTGTYDAAAHSINVTAPSGATVKYRTASSGDYNLTTNPTFTDAGTYTVYYQVTKANYTAVTGSATVKINPIELTLTWSDNNAFIYNGSSQAPTATIDGVINNDDCTVSVSGVQTNYSGEAYTATAELIGERAGNYALPTAHTMTFTIGKKDATITASDQTITYGEAIATGTGYITTDGFVPGDSPTAITLTPSTSDVTTSGTITPSNAVIKNGNAIVSSNYNITYNAGALTINKAHPGSYTPATYKPLLKYTGEKQALCTAAAYHGSSTEAKIYYIISEDTPDITKINDASYGWTIDIPTEKEVGRYYVWYFIDTGNNYDDIGPFRESNEYTEIAKGTNGFITSPMYASGLSYTGRPQALITNTPVAKEGTLLMKVDDGEYSTAIPTATTPGNHTISFKIEETTHYVEYTSSRTVSIGKATLAPNIHMNDWTYGETPAQPTYTLPNDLDESLIEWNCFEVYDDGDTGYVSTYEFGDTLDAGTYKLKFYYNSGDNRYNSGIWESNEFTVSRGTMTPDMYTLPVVYENLQYNGTTQRLLDFSNPDEAEYEFRVKDKATGEWIIAGRHDYTDDYDDKPFAVAAGTYQVYYILTSLNYNDIEFADPIEVTISQKSLTITADSDSKVYDGTALTKNSYTKTVLATGDSVESVTVTGSQTVVGRSANVPSAAVIKNENGDDVTASYDITYANGTLEVTKKAVTITVDSASKVYDGTALTKGSFEADGLTDGDSIESIAVTGSQTNAGKCDNVPDEAVIINAAGEDVTANYDITYVNGTLEVTKKEIVISGISAVDKIYDGTVDAELDYSGIDWSACGMVDGDELSVTADCSFEDANAGNDKTVELSDITLDGESVDNYILAEDGQQTETYADIIKKAVTVTALKQTVAINGRIIDSVDYSELIDAIEGHELSEITLTSGSTKEVTAEGVITPSDAKILDGDIDVTDNYDITYIDGVMTVTKAEAEVVLDNGDAEEVCVTEAEVPNLIELAESEAEEGRIVKVELSVKAVSEDEIDELTVSDIKAAAENIFVDTGKLREKYLKIDLTKYIDDERIGSISDAGMPLEIILTCNTSITDNPVVIRNHEGAVEVFKRLAARPSGSFEDETYYVDGDKIYIYSQYFSNFAIAYSIEKTFNVSLYDGMGNVTRQIVSEGALFIPPYDLTNEGYELDGWYMDEEFTQKWDPDKDKVTSDIELNARWVKKEVPSDTSASMTDNPAEKAADANASAKLTDKKSLISKSPATGDGAKSGIAGILMVISFMAAMYLMFRRRSR